MIQKTMQERDLLLQSESQISNKEEHLTEMTSNRTDSRSPERQSSLGKEKVFSRKPNNQNSNLQSFKLLRRKSQQKIDRAGAEPKIDHPPRCPRFSQELKQSSITEVTGPSSQPSFFSSAVIEEQKRKSEAGVRFKKKAMSKEQIIEVKAFLQSQLQERIETNTLVGSQKGVKEVGLEQLLRQANKKSKTQYFNFQDVHGQDYELPETISQSDRLFVASLKEKCRSADENASLMQKRIKWMRDEVQMHLERQAQYKKEKQDLIKQIQQKDQIIAKEKERGDKIYKQFYENMAQIDKLQELVIELNQQFDKDREALILEIQQLKNEKDNEFQALERKYSQHIRQLQTEIQSLKESKPQDGGQPQPQEADDHYSHNLIQKLLNQNKYLKMENHMLGRYKQDLAHLKRQNKQISNERDTLKKKIIQNAKKQALRMKRFDDSDNSETFTMSELTYSLSQLKK